MKDLDGREYDGWVMRYPEDWGGNLISYSFKETRTQLWDRWIKYDIEREPREAAIQRYRRRGFRLVKVKLIEVMP